MGDMSHEPSMEEILSSIKKIIAEDGDKPSSIPRLRRSSAREPLDTATATDVDVLELTEAVQEAETESLVVSPAAPPVDLAPPAAPVLEKPQEAVMKPSEENILAEKPAAASRNAFAQLTTAKAQTAPTDPTSNAIEAMVKDMLRPMLKEWLDANLPRVVEKMVAKEIARLRED